ncbi:MAG: heavy-metal-associated domain-containing protein [Dokdonia sp.]|nr:heavy-metal-associated domain-containing protein [Dokdonia sp.]
MILSLFAVTATQAQKNGKQMDAFEVQVDGLGCPFCAYGLEKKFKEFKGIKKVAIDIETGDFSFLYPTEKALTMDAVVEQVKKAGYTPNIAKITRADGTIENSEAAAVTQISADTVLSEASVTVAGKCGMCEARILKATSGVVGIIEASWNKDSQLLDLRFDEKQTSLDAIQKVVAEAGHDTNAYKTSEAAYADLPGCCKYERIEQ